MVEPIKKEDIKEALTEALEPFTNAIKKDFDRVDERFEKIDGRFNKIDERFEKIETTLIAVVEDLKEARKERQELKVRINETYSAVDGFIKVVDKLEVEFAALKEDLNRIKKVIKEKLGVDLFR
jgi:chromosome segregation ATPase